MNLSQAIKKISWKFRNQKSFKIYRDDIEAWNKILETLDGHINSKASKNQVASKFIIEHYRQLIKYFDSDVFDDIPIKELAKIAEKPFERHVNEFAEFLNNREMIKLSDGLTETEINQMSKDEVDGELKKLKDAGRSFTPKEAEKNLVQIISELIRNHEN